MKTTKTSEVLPNIYTVSNRQVCFYVVKTNQNYIAIDAGGNSNMSVNELNKLNIKTEDVLCLY